MLAHGRLVTTDLPAALGFTAALYAFWRFLREPGWVGAAVTGVAVGIALLTKFSMLLLGLLLPLLALLWIGRRQFPAGPPILRIARVAAALAIIGALAWGVVWAGYGFRYAATTDPDYRLEWESLTLDDGPVGRAISWAKERRAAPEAFLYGLATARVEATERRAFLNGEQSVTGWWYFFPEAFLLKTPPALLVLLTWVVFAGIRRTRTRSFDGWYLAVPVLVYFGISMAGNINLGHRHLAPIYPLLFVAAGGASRLLAGRLRGWAVPALLALYVVSSYFSDSPAQCCAVRSVGRDEVC